MFRRNEVIQDKVVAHKMRRFFKRLTDEQRAVPREVAIAYCRKLWSGWTSSLASGKKLSRSRFYVGLAVDNSNLAEITKRATLVTDTLLLSHGYESSYVEIGWIKSGANERISAAPALMGSGTPEEDAIINPVDVMFGVHCPDLDKLGQWILDSEPLLRAGLAWYLPSYATSERATKGSSAIPKEGTQRIGVVDYLIRDGRAVGVSDECPIKSEIIKPILEIELPFIEGVDLRDFSRITVGEFQSYEGFRDFLRTSFLAMDDALTATQSERELARIGLDIADQVRATRSEMLQVSRKRAVAVTGAAVGSTTAVLTAVYGPALAAAVTAVGAAGGWFPALQAMVENSKKAVREDKWYYVWMLQEAKSRSR